MKAKIVTLYEYNVSVDFTRYHAAVYKYRLRFTGRNYIPIHLDADAIAQKFNTPPLRRIGTDELMKLRQHRKMGEVVYINHRVFFLKEDFEQAKLLVNTAIAGAVQELVKQTELVQQNWEEGVLPQNPLDRFRFTDEKNA